MEGHMGLASHQSPQETPSTPFSERPCLKAVRQRETEDNQCPPLGPAHMHWTGTHTCTSTYTCMYTLHIKNITQDLNKLHNRCQSQSCSVSQVIIVYLKKQKRKSSRFCRVFLGCAVILTYCRSCVGEFAHPPKLCCDSKRMTFTWLFTDTEKRSDKSPAKQGGSI